MRYCHPEPVEGSLYEVVQTDKPQIFRLTAFAQDDGSVRFVQAKRQNPGFDSGMLAASLFQYRCICLGLSKRLQAFLDQFRPPLFILLFLLLFPVASSAQALFTSTETQGLALIQQGDLEEAIPYLEQAIEAFTPHAVIYAALAEAYVQTDQLDAADSLVDLGLARFEGNTDLLVQQAQLRYRQNRPREALRLYERLEQQTVSGQHPTLDSGVLRASIGQFYHQQGILALQKDDLATAIRSLRRSLAYQPDSIAVYQALAVAYLESQDWLTADSIAQMGLERAPDDANLLRAQGAAQYGGGDYAALVSTYERLYNQHPDDLDIQWMYARALALTGNTDAAAQHLATVTQHPDAPREAFDLLVRLYERHLNVYGIIAALETLHHRQPNDADILWRLAKYHTLAKQWAEARHTYSAWQTVSGDTLAAQQAIATTYVQQDSLQHALATYDDLSTAYPQHPLVLRERGVILQQIGAHAAALRAFERLVKRDTSATALLLLAEMQDVRQQPMQAIETYRRALRQDTLGYLAAYGLAQLLQFHPENTPSGETVCTLSHHATQHGLEVIQEQAQRFEAVQASAASLLDLEDTMLQSDDATKVHKVVRSAALLFSETCASKQVESAFAKWIGTFPDSGMLQYVAGHFYVHQHNLEQAQTHLEAAVRLSPRLVDAQEALARLYEQQGNSQQALLTYERVLGIAPTHGGAYHALIELYTERGHLRSLIERWEVRHRVDPHNDTLADALQQARARASQ